jgi:hypothetical protein
MNFKKCSFIAQKLLDAPGTYTKVLCTGKTSLILGHTLCTYNLTTTAHMWAAGLWPAAQIRKSEAAPCTRRVCGALNTEPEAEQMRLIGCLHRHAPPTAVFDRARF